MRARFHTFAVYYNAIHMYKSYLACFTALFILTSCDRTVPRITAVCDVNRVGNHILSWEISPRTSGKVKVYASPRPDTLLSKFPIGMADISDKRMTVVSDNPLKRTYYTMVFNDKYTVKVAPRHIPVSGIQNFRDMGGYHAMRTDKDIRWGMLYRSAQIDTLDFTTRRQLQGLGIRTIIDLRSPEEAGRRTDPDGFNVVHIPITAGSLPIVLKEVLQGTVKSDTINRVGEQVNRSLIADFCPEYKQIFDVLLDRNNYPVLVQCTSGKGRTGVVSALVMSALHVNEDDIMADYRLSNNFFDIRKAYRVGEHMPEPIQEAITILFSARTEYLDAAFDEVERRYGDMNTYLSKGIGLTPSDIQRLRDILLVSENN